MSNARPSMLARTIIPQIYEYDTFQFNIWEIVELYTVSAAQGPLNSPFRAYDRTGCVHSMLWPYIVSLKIN